MSTIKFTFDGLCAYFTGNLDNEKPELIVGLIDVSDWPKAPETDYHYPVLTIKSAGRLLKKYEGFAALADGVYGLNNPGDFLSDIFLDAPEGSEPIKAFEEPSENDKRLPFSKIIMIDKLGPGLTADLTRCKARVHLSNGLLYSMNKGSVEFIDLMSGRTETIAPVEAATMVGLEVTIPDGKYVVLHFKSNAEDFVFKGGLDYQVSLVNNPSTVPDTPASEHDHGGKVVSHFAYYYNLVTTRPAKLLVPKVRTATGQPTGGSPICMPGGFDEP